MSNMFLRNSNLLQCFMWILLLWPAIVNSFPTTDLALNDRYQRATSDTEFPQSGGPYELVIQGEAQDVFEFKVCCNKDDGCSDKKFTFCFPSSSPSLAASVYATGAGCNEPQTCAYHINFDGVTPDNKRSVQLFMTSFNTSNCFQGRLTSTHMYALNTEADLVKVDGCPLELDSKRRFIVNILNAIPDGVTVTATNAQKYIEPTTLPPSTVPPAAETTNASKDVTPAAAATKEESGMSDAWKFSLIGVGLFVFVLIVGGIGFAIYWFCFKKKKSPKPALPVTVAKTDTAAAKQASTAPPIMPLEVKPKEAKKADKETKDVKDSKLAPSNVVPSSAAPPPPPTASKEPSAVPSKPEQQKSLLPGPSLEPSSVINPPVKVRQSQPPELPPATPTIADLIGRVGRRYRVGGRKYFDTFDRIQVPHFEGIFESMIRNGWITEDQALKVKKEKFIRQPSEEELKLFAAPISVMYQLLEEMIDDAAYSHNKTKHDENAQCTLVENEFHTYFVSLYAVVVHYAKYFKVGKEVPLEKCSVPLLLGIAMDRSQSESLRRRALVIMTIKAVDLTRIFTEPQCIKLPYPMCVICLSYQLDRYLVDNVYRLHTYSSPNNSECSKSDQQKTGGVKSGAAGKSRRGDGEKQSSSSSSKLGTKTSVSKEVVVSGAVEKKKKMKKKGKKH